MSQQCQNTSSADHGGNVEIVQHGHWGQPHYCEKENRTLPSQHFDNGGANDGSGCDAKLTTDGNDEPCIAPGSWTETGLAATAATAAGQAGETVPIWKPLVATMGVSLIVSLFLSKYVPPPKPPQKSDQAETAVRHDT